MKVTPLKGKLVDSALMFTPWDEFLNNIMLSAVLWQELIFSEAVNVSHPDGRIIFRITY